MPREEKITFGEMRESGATKILVHCICGRAIQMDARRWSDDMRLSDIEPRFFCQVCGHRGADVRPSYAPARMGT